MLIIRLYSRTRGYARNTHALVLYAACLSVCALERMYTHALLFSRCSEAHPARTDEIRNKFLVTSASKNKIHSASTTAEATEEEEGGGGDGVPVVNFTPSRMHLCYKIYIIQLVPLSMPSCCCRWLHGAMYTRITLRPRERARAQGRAPPREKEMIFYF